MAVGAADILYAGDALYARLHCIAEDEFHNDHNDRHKYAEVELAGGGNGQIADKGFAPDIPHIYIESLCFLECKHKEVYAYLDREHQKRVLP